MKELLRCVELLYGINKLDEPFWVRVRGEVGKGDMGTGDKKTLQLGQGHGHNLLYATQ